MVLHVKICGLSTKDAITAAQDADYIGFIFYPTSPRNITVEKAAELASGTKVPTVAVTVDADDNLLRDITTILKPSYLQLHGKETPQRVRSIKDTFKIPVIKAISISTHEDMVKAQAYETVADMLMFDAKASKGMPGGNGLAFDWHILADQQFKLPWFLSGGLSADNVEEALRITGAGYIDVSSGVESAPGVKDSEKMRAFIKKVRSVDL